MKRKIESLKRMISENLNEEVEAFMESGGKDVADFIVNYLGSEAEHRRTQITAAPNLRLEVRISYGEHETTFSFEHDSNFVSDDGEPSKDEDFRRWKYRFRHSSGFTSPKKINLTGIAKVSFESLKTTGLVSFLKGRDDFMEILDNIKDSPLRDPFSFEMGVSSSNQKDELEKVIRRVADRGGHSDRDYDILSTKIKVHDRTLAERVFRSIKDKLQNSFEGGRQFNHQNPQTFASKYSAWIKLVRNMIIETDFSFRDIEDEDIRELVRQNPTFGDLTKWADASASRRYLTKYILK